MSDEPLIRHCAPTLANIKTANLFSCAFSCRKEMFDDVRRMNRRLQGKGLRVISLRFREGRGLIYVYRPDKLSRDLADAGACRLLRECGYNCSDERVCIRKLMERLEIGEEFPHEIGLFLGYPPEDVDGFINRREAFLCCGTWKVYSNVEAAKTLFARYRKCSEIYWQQWVAGKSIERLTVAVS